MQWYSVKKYRVLPAWVGVHTVFVALGNMGRIEVAKLDSTIRSKVL